MTRSLWTMETLDGLVEVTWSLIRGDNIRGANPHPYIFTTGADLHAWETREIFGAVVRFCLACQGEQFEVRHGDP